VFNFSRVKMSIKLSDPGTLRHHVASKYQDFNQKILDFVSNCKFMQQANAHVTLRHVLVTTTALETQ
jgi:hypothetical protein